MNKEKQKGITLIALIITIIVILILVAVSVRTISKSGLFDHAKDATNKWGDAQNKEGNVGDDVEELIKEQIGIHNWIRNGDDIHCDHCGLEFVIGDYLDYQPDLTSKTITITKEEAGYLETKGGSTEPIYSPDEEEVQDQIFTQQPISYWQVLGVEDNDGNGTNETLLLKMAAGTEKLLNLCGSAPYERGPEIMNRISKELYSSSKYGEARSINITDVNNTLQYTPTGGFYYDSGWKELTGFNTQAKDLPNWNIIKEKGVFTPDGTNTEEKLGSYKINGYYYELENDGLTITSLEPGGNTTMITENTRNVIFLRPSGDDAFYWLADRSAHANGRRG